MALEDKKWTQNLLFYAAKHSKPKCFEWLRRSEKLNINLVDTLHTQTPLFYAVAHSDAAMVTLCLELKADPNVTDKLGKLPLQWARSVEVLAALVNGGSRLPRLPLHMHKPTPPDVERLLTKFIEAKAKAGKGYLAWNVRLIGSKICTYVVTHSLVPDVDELCELENEFIKDHDEQLLESYDEGDNVFGFLPLNSDPARRKAAVHCIASGAGLQGEPTCQYSRYSTLQCTVTDEEGGRKVAGYCFYRICFEAKENKWTLRYANVKVSQHFQRQGVGTLIMAGVLSSALYEFPDFPCHEVKIAVLKGNLKAENLYSKLLFVEDPESAGSQSCWQRLIQATKCGKCGGITKKAEAPDKECTVCRKKCARLSCAKLGCDFHLCEKHAKSHTKPDLLSLRKKWLALVPGITGGCFAEEALGNPEPPPPKLVVVPRATVQPWRGRLRPRLPHQMAPSPKKDKKKPKAQAKVKPKVKAKAQARTS